MFANGPLDSPLPDGTPLARGLALRFFATAPDSDGHDRAILIREVPVAENGSVRARGLPAETPMFEQLVDSDRLPVMSAHGPSHVAGFNFGAAGSTVRCVGCHLGHSILPATERLSATQVAWLNASPSAEVTASSSAARTGGARAAVDRRTSGPANQVAWIAGEGSRPWLRLSWKLPLVIRDVVLHAPRPDTRERTNLEIAACEVRFSRNGREVRRRAISGAITSAGTRVPANDVLADAIEIRPLAFHGEVAGLRAAALSEVETIARLPLSSELARADRPRPKRELVLYGSRPVAATIRNTSP